jgi:hypothetical protein
LTGSPTSSHPLGYLDDCRQKCRETIATLSVEQSYRVCRFPWGEVPFGELLLYTMRHVQEHAARLLMFLGQHGIHPS